MGLLDVRLAWILLGLALAVAFSGASVAWLLLWLLAWGPGMLVLARPRHESRIREVPEALSSSRPARLALPVLAAFFPLVAHLLSGSAALLLLALCGTLALLAVAYGGGVTLTRGLPAVALLCVSTAVPLGAAELILRLPRLARSFGTPAERLAWEQRYDRLWERNIHGIRSPHERVARTQGIGRIITLGDSFTWGDKVASTDSTWPALLEARWNDGPLGRLEVINMAERGYTTANEAEYLRRLGWQFDPDLVIIQFLVNDALPSGPNFQRGDESLVYPRFSLLPSRFRRGAIRNSALLAVLEQQYSALRGGHSDALRIRELYSPDAPGWNQMVAALEEIGDSARARQVPVLLTIFPRLLPGEWTEATYPLRDVHVRVAEAARSAGLLVHDLTPVFAARGGDWRQWWATPYDGHPGTAAHQLVAEELVRRLTHATELAAADPHGGPEPQRGRGPIP